MNHSDEHCDCVHCRAGKLVAQSAVISAEFNSASSRVQLVTLRLMNASVASDRQAELALSLRTTVNKALSSCAAAINAACDQIESEVSR